MPALEGVKVAFPRPPYLRCLFMQVIESRISGNRHADVIWAGEWRAAGGASDPYRDKVDFESPKQSCVDGDLECHYGW